MAVQFYAYSSLFTPHPEKMGTRWSREVTYAASDAFVSRLQSAHKADLQGRTLEFRNFLQLVVAPWEFGSDEASSPSTATSWRLQEGAESGRLTGCICHGGNASYWWLHNTAMLVYLLQMWWQKHIAWPAALVSRQPFVVLWVQVHQDCRAIR